MLEHSAHYVYLWIFQVKPGCEDRFENTYGPEGEWVSLFKKAPGYLLTELLRDKTQPGRYLTIDHWESDLSHQRFRQEFDADFRALDQLCEGLTDSEALIGHFSLVTPHNPGESVDIFR